MLRAFCTYIPNLNDEKLVKSMLSLLTKERIVKTDKYYRTEDKLRSAVAELLLGYGYYQENSLIECELPEIACAEYGKPYFVDTESLEFNISHAGNYVVCIFGDCKVGIDIEIITEKIDLDFSKHCFTEAEHQFIIEEKQSIQRKFYNIWTLKESYIKNLGTGMYKSLRSFSIRKFDERYCVYEGNQYQNVFLRLWDQYEKFSISICVSDNYDELQALSLEWVLFDDLIEFYGLCFNGEITD